MSFELAAVIVIGAAVTFAGWHTDRTERRNRWRRLAAASALPRAGWELHPGTDDVPRLLGVYYEACKTACKHPSCRTSRARVLLRWVDTRRELSSPGRAVRRPGGEPHVCDGERTDSGSPTAPRCPCGSSVGLPRPGSVLCLPPADL